MCKGVYHGMMTDSILHEDQLIAEYVELEKYGVLIKIVWKNDPDDAFRRRIKEIMLNQSKGYILIYFTLYSSYNQTLNTVCPLNAEVNFSTFKLGIIEYFDCLNGCLCVWQNDCNVNIKCDAVNLRLIFYPHHHKILTQGKVKDLKVFINAYCRTINKILPNSYKLNDFKGSLIEKMFRRNSLPSTPNDDFKFSPFSPRGEFHYPTVSPDDILRYTSTSSSQENEYSAHSAKQQYPPVPPREAVKHTPASPKNEFSYPSIPPKLDLKCLPVSPHEQLIYPAISPKEEFRSTDSVNMSKDSSGIDCLCSPKPNLSISSDYDEDWELIAGKGSANIGRKCSKQDLMAFKDSLNTNLYYLNDKLSHISDQLTCIPDLIKKVDHLEGLKSTVQKYRQIEETGGLSFEEQEDIVGENVRLRKENVELRLSLQKRQHKIDDLFKENVQQKIQYEEQNVKVKDLMNQLQSEATEKGIALTQTAATNQEILSKSLKYQGELKQYKERYNDEFQRLLCNLGREMGFCIDDVKSFLNLCISRIKGDEPSLNSLLGLREPSDKVDNPPPVIDINYIKSQYKDMAELRKEIDDLRRLVSEHYAQEIGDNMCITQ